MFLSTACVCHQHVGPYLRLLAISGVCDKHAGASFRLLPAVSVLDQYLGPSLRLHSIAAGLWEYSLEVCFGIFAIATIGKLNKIRTSDRNVKDDSLG